MQIGDLRFENPFLLAPLAGITDKTMRSLCSQAGASLTYTEMVSGKGLKYGDKNTGRLLEIAEGEGPVAYQLFGSEPEVMEYSARTLAGRKNCILDLNSGCPVPKIVKNGEGSALLKNPETLYDVISAMVKGARIGAEESGLPVKPVTVKIRKGFYRDDNVALEAAKAAEAAGAAAVAVHGRTREQYYEGKADWKVIETVKSALKIPVIGNGDVMTGVDAMRMIEETGCDGVMIARGALGNPWIFTEAVSLYKGEDSFVKPSPEERLNMLMHHIDLVVLDKGERTGIREMRKHVGWYIKGMRGAAAMRREMNSAETVGEMKSLIDDFKKIQI